MIRRALPFASLVLFTLLAPHAARAQAPRLAGPVPAELVRVIDGDTLEVRVQVWLEQELTVRARLADVDAPELRRPGCPAERELAEQARDFVARALGEGALSLSDITHDKYARRVVARVRDAQGRDLSELLLEAGLALPYPARGAWCGDS